MSESLCKGWSGIMRMNSYSRTIAAVALPFLACGVQWSLWQTLSPFVWFLFFPTVFFSAWLGGMVGGLLSTIISATLVWYVFIPSQFSWTLKNYSNAYSVIMFLGMGWLFSWVFTRLSRTTRQLMNSNEQITQLYEKTKEIDTLKTQFFANISHELRTPLALILGPTSKWLREKALDENLRNDIEIINRNAQLLHHHVDELLDFAKLEDGKMGLLYAKTDLAHQIRMLASYFALLADEQRINFSVHADDPVDAEVDLEKFHRIVLNVLSNAFKFTPEGGAISVDLRSMTDLVLIRISDTGPGIPEGRQESIFEAFRQLEETSTRTHGGTGLGLSIAKEFVKLHGGTISVKNRETGGSEFSIVLPNKAPLGTKISSLTPEKATQMEDLGNHLSAELRHALKPAPSDLPSDAERPLILVVEDNVDMNQFICSVLQPGFRVVVAYDGKEGVAKALANKPDLIVTDIMMPGTSGEMMLQEIQCHPELEHTPIIILTAKADDSLQLRMLQEGIRDYIQKPFLPEVLLAKVSTIVNEHQDTVRKLREGDLKLEKAFQNAPVMLAIMDQETGRYLEVNDEVLRASGYERKEILGRSDTEIGWSYPENQLRMLSEIHEKGRIRRMELQLRTKDGHTIIGRVNGEIISISGKDALLTVTEDITDQVKIAEKLTESNRRLSLALDSAELAVWDWDVRNNTMYWDNRMFELYGVTRTAFSSNIDAWHGGLHPEDKDCAIAECNAALAGTRTFDTTFRVKPPNGTTKYIKANGTVVRDMDGKAIRMLGVNRDITAATLAAAEKAQLEARLQHAQKMEAIGTLAGGIAHDFNNLLGAIMGNTELCLMSLPEEGEITENLRDVMAASERAKALVQQILAFSRKRERRISPVDINQIVTEAMKLLISVIPKTIDIQLELNADGGTVLADATELHQVVMNLCTNAYQAMAETGGVLKVTLSKLRVDNRETDAVPNLTQGSYIRLTVTDSGPGMDEQTLARIFEPYFTTKVHGKGTGLGLALVHGIVYALKGTIQVFSTPGQGTSFAVYLPQQEEPSCEADSQDRAASSGNGRILLVDDEPSLARLGRKILEGLGYAVQECTDPMEAIHLFESGPFSFDAIVTDQTMPGLTGSDLIQKIKDIRPEMAAVLCTGFSELMDATRATEQGIKFVQKPYTRDSLGIALAEAISGRE